MILQVDYNDMFFFSNLPPELLNGTNMDERYIYPLNLAHKNQQFM